MIGGGKEVGGKNGLRRALDIVETPRWQREVEVGKIVPVAGRFLSFRKAVSLSTLTRTVRLKGSDW